MNNAKIKALALKHGFKLKEQANGELDLNDYVYKFAWALLQAGKVGASHRQYLSDLLQDVANCRPVKTPGYHVSIYANDSCADTPRIQWNFYNGVSNDTYSCEVPDTRDELNNALSRAKGHMQSASYRAMNPDFDKKLV